MSLTCSGRTETSKQRLVELQNRLRSINEQKNEIERQRESLRHNGLDLLRSYKPVEQELQTEAERYSRAWCRDFALILRSKLPRELRDMIYRYLVLSNSSIRINCYVESDEDSEWGFWGGYWNDRPAAEKYLERVANLRGPCHHFVNLESVDDDVSSEITQNFYEENQFSLSIGDVNNFLTKDIFLTGRIPAESVRNVKINMGDRTMMADWNWDCSGMNAEPPQTEDGVIAAWPNKGSVAAQFENLSMIKNKERCTVGLVIRTTNNYVRHALLVNVGSIVFHLRDQGFGLVTVSQSSKKRKKGFPAAETIAYAWPGIQWDKIFDMPRAEWEERVKTKTLLVGRKI
ncbi:hypothetical protein P154DRAFT_527746 [Amniculicola lignicola CBS 123094]|uniref:Uncharacterized protein n=1 Tax=Amniculicola lignicola CBS 123094 TaxID=1392246 RepID=A0A6A5VX47_9PLEO|nr:hypothetical protein P154DRAFT_527746 [Amniculicola lignicola CBS 123094]